MSIVYGKLLLLPSILWCCEVVLMNLFQINYHTLLCIFLRIYTDCELLYDLGKWKPILINKDCPRKQLKCTHYLYIYFQIFFLIQNKYTYASYSSFGICFISTQLSDTTHTWVECTVLQFIDYFLYTIWCLFGPVHLTSAEVSGRVWFRKPGANPLLFIW